MLTAPLPRLSPSDRLVRSSSLVLHLDGPETVWAETPHGGIWCGPGALRVLDVFARPTELRQAMDRLGASAAGIAEWLEHLEVIRRLLNHGILRGGSETDLALSDRIDSDELDVHRRLLNDEGRTLALLRAIRHVVRPGDVVVEIGSGSGILSLAAARAGARRVYAVESGTAASLTSRMAAQSGLQEVISVIPGWSTEISLPERGNVLIAELIGHDPFAERLLPAVRDAQARHLHPGAALIPSSLSLWTQPVEVPAELTRVPCEDEARRWLERYGFDFSPLLTAHSGPYAIRTTPSASKKWRSLGPAQSIGSLDLASDLSTSVSWEFALRFTEHGLWSGLLLFFRAELPGGEVLTNQPSEVPSSWYLDCWIPEAPRPAHPGLSLELSYRSAPGSVCQRLVVK